MTRHPRNGTSNDAAPGRHALVAIACLGLSLVTAAPSSWADDQELEPFELPIGVTVTLDPETYQRVLELLRQGNALMGQLRYSEARETYMSALELSDDPAIHYNLSSAQRNLGRPLEAYHSLEEVLSHSPEVLGQDVHERATLLLEEVESLLSRIVIICPQPGVNVTVDGRIALSVAGDGQYESLVEAGFHQIVVTREGYETVTRHISTEQDEVRTLKVILERPVQYVTRRPYVWWKPWLVVGVGGTVGLLGGVFHWRSYSDYRTFDEQFHQRCSFQGCLPDSNEDLFVRLERAEQLKVATLSTYALGGALIVGGLVWVILNEPELVALRHEESSARPAVSITPALSREGASVLLRIDY